MARHQIPTAPFQTFDSLGAASLFIQSQQASIFVIKAVGLISGRGVWITESKAETVDLLGRIFDKQEFGLLSDCGPIIVEEFLEGPEFSVLALTDGNSAVIFPPMRDFKRRHEEDKGPNTGGMGCQVPVQFHNREVTSEVETKFFNPTIAGMMAEGIYALLASEKAALTNIGCTKVAPS
jgi:phosphoribosylamine-glycine ligase